MGAVALGTGAGEGAAPLRLADHAMMATGLPFLGADEARTYRLGIMGGTFDPIHHGHLVAAESALRSLGLDLVVFMPAGSPAFKQGVSMSTGEDRYAMTLLATADHPCFYASRFEVDRPGVTFTADTLTLLRELYPPNVEFYFITGADAIAEVPTWHDAGTIARLAHLVAATRPGYDLARARRELEASPYEFDVRYIEVPALAISSSHLRQRVAEGQSLRYLTPAPVGGYVAKHGLYRTDSRAPAIDPRLQQERQQAQRLDVGEELAVEGRQA